MSYEIVTVYTGAGDFLGFSLRQAGSKKLHTANLWEDTPEDREDLRKQLGRLNDQVDVLAFWPDVRDPDVQALVNDESWMPLAKSPTEVVDEANSVFVWIVPPDEENPYGKMDEDNSVIVTKTIMVPAPADVQRRIKQACETVARQRAFASTGNEAS